MNLTQQLKNQKEQNAKIVGENFELNRNLETEKRANQRLLEQKLKLQGEIIGLEKVIRILTNKESNPPF